MSVRHIHAHPGEYIAVHRGGGNGSSADSEKGFAVLIIAVAVILFLFWKAILTFLFYALMVCLGVAFAAGALWLLWTYRSPIWQGICWIARKLWRAICWLSPKVWFGACWVAKRLWLGGVWIVRKLLWYAARWCWGKCCAVCGTIRNKSRRRLNARYD